MAEFEAKTIENEDEILEKIPSWFPLDVAGIIYPNARRYGWCTTYRFAFIMKGLILCHL